MYEPHHRHDQHPHRQVRPSQQCAVLRRGLRAHCRQLESGDDSRGKSAARKQQMLPRLLVFEPNQEIDPRQREAERAIHRPKQCDPAHGQR